MNANFKHFFAGIAVFTALFLAPWAKAEKVGSVDIHDRVGNGWHMYTTATVDDDGTISGVTTLKNYNNLRGFTGGLFVVAVDEDMSPIYSTDVHSWGINAAFFKKKRTRTATWEEQIPMEYFEQAASIAIVQQHTPTNRVWVWIKDNHELIIEKALNFLELFQKINNDEEITEEDILQAVQDVVDILDAADGDSWFMEHVSELYDIALKVYNLAQKEEDGWVPENYDETVELVNQIADLCQEGLDWEDLDEVQELIVKVNALIGYPEGWVPENLSEVQEIVEALYETMEDENIPDSVREVIEYVIEKMDELNN